MSFAEARIREYLASTITVGRRLTEVRFARARVGDLEIAILAQDRTSALEQDVLEDEIERQLVREGLIRVPSARQRTDDGFKRIDVAGKPISEMIIEERR